MNDELIKNAEQKAVQYFESLKVLVSQKSYVSTLINNIQSWKPNHIHHRSLFSLFSGKKKKPNQQDYYHYIRWLDYTGKLDNYLDRSISYIFMRDLGKDLGSTETLARIQRIVEVVKNHLTQSSKKGEIDTLNMAWLYRKAQKEGIESTIIWVIHKLKTVSNNIPRGMNALHAQRKLIKLIAGVLMYELEEMDYDMPPKVRAKKLDKAIRLGYYYGLTYPFIDDLLDAGVLSDKEKKQYSEMIRTTLTTGVVPEIGEWSEEIIGNMHYIHAELREAFEFIVAHQRQETRKNFFEQSYVFFHSQEKDRLKDLANTSYTNEEIYIPVILKSASSRLIIRSVIGAPFDEGYDNRTFFYGIYNQLADDFADMFEDMEVGAVTPYTYYLKYHDIRSDLINPFELYWAVISYLINDVYHSDAKTCEVILDRAINGLKRYKERMGVKKYHEVMDVFASFHPPFNHVVQNMVQNADDVDFFDKLLRDQMITILKKEQNEHEDFLCTIKIARKEINSILYIPETDNPTLLDMPIIDAANYSLNGDGKRLRPMMTWVMGVNEYGLDSSTIVPLLRSIEYMHTASLIFDDLPSQDNAPIRRGRPTLHQVYGTAMAELTGLFLTQKAIEEQASLHHFNAKVVLRLIKYSAKMTKNMCKGQAMDLGSKGKRLTLDQLNVMCFYKTGIAFEASLIMPAILAQVSDSEMEILKKYAHHAGIAFQIKDDLLDVEGVSSIIGKSIGKDAENNNSTFVSFLGTDGAKKAMWEHYCLAMEALQEGKQSPTFLKHLLNYIVNRDK